MLFPDVRTKRTASALNSGVKLRRFRGGFEGLVELMDTSFIMTELEGSEVSTETGKAQVPLQSYRKATCSTASTCWASGSGKAV